VAEARRSRGSGWLQQRFGRRRARRVLVVDDDEAIRSLLVVTLTAAGFRVIEATTGADGLALLDQEPVSVAVLDAAMPDMSGLEVAAKLGAGGYPDRPKVLLLGRLPADADEGTVDAQLPKPFEPSELVEWVEVLAT
jgi:DNA-binding response OmpR family regulator